MNAGIKTPTDEQLAAYVSNTASPEDTAVVEAWIKEDPKHLDELLDMTVAASLPGRKQAAVPLVPWYRRPVYWAAAAVVALVLVAGVLWYQPNGVNQGPVVADTHVPAVTDEEPDVMGWAWEDDEPAVTGEEPQTAKRRASKVAEESLPSLPLQRQEHSTASKAVATPGQPMLELDFPQRYREECVAGKSITFRWQSNATVLRLVITDDEGTVLHKRDLTGRSEYTLPASVLQGQPELHWMFVGFFVEGQSMRREGIIIQMTK